MVSCMPNIGLKDSHSYVRKTAVMCVPKIYEISPELVDQSEMIPLLQNIVENDSNAQVVANAIQALVELSKMA